MAYQLEMENQYALAANVDRITKSPTWYKPPVDPADIRKLMQKSDRIATRDTLIWIGLMIATAAIGIALWPSWASVPFWIVYGVLYGSASDSRWHECGHRTAFVTPWKNEVVYQMACFMLLRNPVTWRSSHVRHHTDTIIVGRDPEIITMRPPQLALLVINLFGIIDTKNLVQRMFLHAAGRLTDDEATYVRDIDRPSVYLTARIWIAIYLAVVIFAIWTGSILPLMVVGLPRLYGAWHHVMTGVLQHLGLAENVSDHRLNTRTVLMNPFSRFVYLNMNYHLEHHLFTMVPYYNLPKLHRLIQPDVPAPEPSIFAAFRRLLPVLVKQLRYKDAVIIPDLPKGATPYGDEVEKLRPHAA